MRTWLRKGNLKREIESLQAAVQNNAIGKNPVKAKIDRSQQNSWYRLCGVRSETINHIISGCCKLSEKYYKTKHNWVGKVIHWELCKKFRFDHTNKWYMHNPTSILENEFDIEADQLISARWLDLIIINKKVNLQNCGLCCPGWSQNKESEKKVKYLDLARESKKTVGHESDVYTNWNLCSWYSHQRTGGLGNNRTREDHPNYCYIEVG